MTSMYGTTAPSMKAPTAFFSSSQARDDRTPTRNHGPTRGRALHTCGRSSPIDYPDLVSVRHWPLRPRYRPFDERHHVVPQLLKRALFQVDHVPDRILLALDVAAHIGIEPHVTQGVDRRVIGCRQVVVARRDEELHVRVLGKRRALSLIHISEPTRRTPISYAVF